MLFLAMLTSYATKLQVITTELGCGGGYFRYIGRLNHQLDCEKDWIMSLRIDGNITQLSDFFQHAANSRLLSWLMLCAFFWMVAAASLSGFAGKWGLLDGESRGGIEAMLDGTASKPILFRQLAPMLANLVDSVAPKQLKERALSIDPSKTFARMTSAAKPSFHFRYIIIYYIVFL